MTATDESLHIRNSNDLPASHWAHDPAFVEFLPVLDPRMTRDEAQAFKDVVLGECEAQANYIKDPSLFIRQLKAADDAALYRAYRFVTCARTAAESSAAVIPRIMAPRFVRQLEDIRREAARRRVAMVLDDEPLDQYAVGMILHLGFGPEARRAAYEAAGLPNPFNQPG